MGQGYGKKGKRRGGRWRSPKRKVTGLDIGWFPRTFCKVRRVEVQRGSFLEGK